MSYAGVSDNSIDVWTVRIDVGPAIASRFQSYLSADELIRAGRFRFDRLRRAFAVSRGSLRILLGRYLGMNPREIQLSYGARGKPRLAGAPGSYFNASHSGGLAVYAFAYGCEVGIDVEQIRPIPDMLQIAGRFFCAEEAAEVRELPDDERERAFYLCWTRKEAYIKATGDGMSEPLDSFRVALRPGVPARFIHVGGDAAEAAAWSLHDLDVDPEYAAALAYRDAPRLVRLRRPIDPGELLDGD